MPRQFSKLRSVLVCIGFILGCSPSPMQSDEPRGGPTGIEFHFSPSGDVVGFDLLITRTSCAGENIEPFLVEESVEPDTAMQGAGTFVYLEPGCYDIAVLPKTENGAVSTICVMATWDQFVVVGGHTTEVMLGAVCENEPRGALDVSIATTADATRAHIRVLRVSCVGEPIDALEFVETTGAENLDKPFDNVLFLLPPGCYEVEAKPLDGVGVPVAACLPLTTEAFVIDGAMTEVSAAFVCP